MTTAKPPSFRPQRFTLHLLPEGTDPKFLDDPDLDIDAVDFEGHRVTVLWADQVRAEAAGPQFGITVKSHAALATLWVWCAMVRTGRTRDKYPAFQARVVDLGQDQADDDPADDDPADGYPVGRPLGDDDQGAAGPT